MTLFEALQKLQELDDADELNLLESLDAIQATKDKVDSYRIVLDQLALQKEFWDQKTKEAQSQAKRASNMIDKVKERMIFCLQSFGTNELVGHQHRVKLSSSEKLAIAREPEKNDIFQYESYLRQTFEWDKKKIADALRAQKLTGDDLFKFVSSPHIRWSYAKRNE